MLEYPVSSRYVSFVVGMQFVRQRFPGMSVTSWGRSVAHNVSIPGSAPDSQHLRWTACDVVYDAAAEPEYDMLRRVALGVGLKVIRESNHDHFELL